MTLRAGLYSMSESYLQSLTTERRVGPENGPAAMCVRSKAGNGEAEVVSGNRENRVLFHAQRMEVSYKLDGSIINLSESRLLSVRRLDPLCLSFRGTVRW